MSLKWFHSALPESMLIEDAVRAMIEGDDRVKLPMCYETVGLPFFDRLAESCRILERRYDSALVYESGASHQAAKLQFEAMEKIQKDAQLYREDLNNRADSANPDFFTNPASSAGEQGAEFDHLYVNRSFLVPWAHKVHGVDINGSHARQIQALDGSPPEDLTLPAPTDQDPQAWAQKNLLSGDRLWQLMVGDQTVPRPQYSEGQILFLSMAWLLDTLLTQVNGEWRRIVTDKTDKTTRGFIINGRLNVAELARSVTGQLPVDAEGKKDPAKTIKGHIKSTEDPLMYGLDLVLEFSADKMPLAYRTLYGLARAVWKRKSGKAIPDRQSVQFPPDLQDMVVAELTGATPITSDDLKRCLEKALETTTRLYPSGPSQLIVK